MRDTLPFAPVALRELAAIWQKELSQIDATSDGDDLRGRLAQVYLQILNTDPEPEIQTDAAEQILLLHDAQPLDPTILSRVSEIAKEQGGTSLERRALDRLAACKDPRASQGAKERLGEIFEQTGNRNAAVESWRSAAQFCETVQGEREHACSLYERVLDAAPNDAEAAGRLVGLYADHEDWNKVAELMGVVLRTDCEHGSELLLGLVPRALDTGARDVLVVMIDEAVAWLRPSSPRVQGLQRAKARALAASPARLAEARESYRAIVDAFGSEDDVREYEAFIASIADADERHDERRALYRWRAAHDAQPAPVLLAWAEEEEAYGAREAALATYERFVELAPDGDRAAVALRIARLLFDLRRPSDAREWVRRAVELPTPASAAWLRTLLLGVLDFPHEVVAWQAAEALGRELAQVEVVVRAYGEVILGKSITPELADLLGRRVVALEGDCNVEASFFLAVLQRVFELAPAARWSLDRVKVILGSQARWDDLFCLYDRAIDATASETERAELLDEAAFAARNLAGDHARAIGYLASLRALRPDDGAVSTTLERLYERHDRPRDLVELLEERADRSDGAARQQFRQRIAALRLDLGQVAEAGAVVEAMLAEGAALADVEGLLERLAPHPGQGRALDRLVRLRVSAARGERGVFARVMASFEQTVADKPGLARHVYKAVLLSAIAAFKDAPTDGDFEDAAEGAWQAVGALKSALRKAGDPRRAARLLERAARLPFDRDRQRSLLEQAVELCSEGPCNSKQAIRLYTQIFEEHPSHPFAASSRDRFAELLEAAGEHGKLARLWERQAQIHEGAGAGELWLRAAAACERQGSDDGAVAAYEKAATSGSAASFEALARIYLGRSQWTDAIRVLERLCALAPEPGREGHTLRLADAYLALERSDDARCRLEDALRDDPTYAGAAEMRARLIDLYRRAGAWEPLARSLSDAGRRSEDPAQKVAFFRESAALWGEKLNQPVAAAAALESALSAAPRDAGLHLELASVLESLGEWRRAADVLKECIATCGESSAKDRALLYRRMGLALSAAGDSEGALVQLRVATGLLPANAPILADLGRVALDARHLDVAASAYRGLLLLLRNPDAQGDSVSRPEVILNLSRIALLRGDPRHAAGVLDSALEEALDVGDSGEAFQRGLLEMGRADLVSATLQRRIGRTPSLESRAGALRSLAELWMGSLGRDRELGERIRHHADAMLRELADGQSPGAMAWLALWSVLSRLEDPEAALRRLPQSEGLIPVLKDAVRAMDPGKDRARLQMLLARTVIAKAESSDEAIALLSGVLDDVLACVGPDAPEFLEAALGLGDALERARRRDDALRHYESILDRKPSRAETVRRIAERLEALGSDRLADGFELWMSLDPDAKRLAPRLVDLRAAQGDADASVRALVLALAADPTNRAFVDRLAHHHEEQEDWPAVARVLGGALDKAPSDRPLLLRVVDAQRRAAAGSEVLRLLDAAIAKTPSDPELLRLRAVAREAAGDDEGAAADLRRIAGEAGSVDLVIETLSRIVERGAPAAADAHAIELVEVLLGASRVEQAQGALDRLLARNPRHTGALERTATLAARAGLWDRAADAYGRLLPILATEATSDPGRLAEVGLALADACERAGRPGTAREPIERLLRAQPDTVKPAGQSVEASLAWARLLAKVGRAGDALPVLLDVVARNRGKRHPALGAVHLEIGRAHFAKDELVEAFQALKAGFAVDPRHSELALMLGLLAIDLDDDKTAERALLAVASATAQNGSSNGCAADAKKVRALYQLAAMADAKGETAKAHRWATAASREDPSHGAVRALLDKFAQEPRGTAGRGASRRTSAR